ncbi:MAG: hypothetical protein AAF456_23680 [Planctomycetota bacterium]
MNTAHDISNPPKSSWRSFSLKSLLVLITACAIFFVWRQYSYEYGIVDDWVDRVLADVEANPLGEPPLGSFIPQPALIPGPEEISREDQIRLLTHATKWLDSPQRRTCALKILVEQFPDEAHDELIRIARESEFTHLQREALLLSSLYRNPADIDLFETFLDADDAELRAAAIDAIGIVREPSFDIPEGFDNIPTPIIFRSEPEINLSYLRNHIGGETNVMNMQFIRWDDVTHSISSVFQSRFLKLMTDDPDETVRNAAARAVVNWQDDGYQLRVAEWGVWINEGEDLVLAESIIDEIPPFVHQAGDDYASIRDGRTFSMIIVTKPILHINVDQPMAIDLSVWIDEGRPWFGFPKPDDFSVFGQSMRFQPEMDAIEYENAPWAPQATLADLSDVREGYPWVGPSHRRAYSMELQRIGFRWQSLIAMPEQAPWMELEPVVDEKFQWWQRLREVPSSWISSRGESEKFLYYDGPTRKSSPVQAVLEEDNITLNVPKPWRHGDPRDYHFMYIEVAADGSISAVDEANSLLNREPLELDINENRISGDAVSERLLELLVEKGLNAEEATGLIDCWRPQFFETEGRRLLTIFDRQEYDRLCPIKIRPESSELARVGIVLTEFDGHARTSD